MVHSKRTQRLHELAEGLAEALALTSVIARSENAPRRVHAAVDDGSYNSYPVCGVLAGREVETTSLLANCPDCKTVCRAARIDLYNLFEGIEEGYDPYDEKWDKFAAR